MSSTLSLPITKVVHLLKNKSISAKELTSMCLERIDKIQNLNAFISVNNVLANEEALLADERLSNGKCHGALHGIPIAIKDNWNTKGLLTTCASKMLSNYVAPYNATVVERLQTEGAIIVGKTNLDEFAMGSATVDSFFGPTKNPWGSGLHYHLLDRSSLSPDVSPASSIHTKPLNDGDFYVSGGSSGGAAVAVATGACFGAIGSDTGGSTRNPAAFCGIVGLKPTYGLVSRNGLIPLCNTLDVPGILTRTVDDAATLLNVVAGPDTKDSTMSTKEYVPFTIPEDIDVRDLSIGIPKEYECLEMSAEVLDLWHKTADAFERHGAKVKSVSLPHTKYSIVCYSVLCCCDVASNFARFDGIRYGHRSKTEIGDEHHYAISRREAFGDVVRERILAGNYFLLKKNYEKYFLQAAKVRRLICKDFESVFDNAVDLLLTPVTLSDAVPYSKWILTDNREHNAVDDYCTQPVNMAGLPAVSIPCGFSQNGLPLSLQLIGRLFEEKQLLMAAKWLEQYANFPLLDIKS